jgi:hypothetical protein
MTVTVMRLINISNERGLTDAEVQGYVAKMMGLPPFPVLSAMVKGAINCWQLNRAVRLTRYTILGKDFNSLNHNYWQSGIRRKLPRKIDPLSDTWLINPFQCYKSFTV